MAKLQTIKGDWSDHEHSRIDRIRAECAGYEGLEVDCSHTDERDPCCIVYDRESDEVIVHIARIDCRYTVMRASRQWPSYSALEMTYAQLDTTHRQPRTHARRTAL